MGRTQRSNSKKLVLLCALAGFVPAAGSLAASVRSPSNKAATRAELEFQKGLKLAAANRTDAAIQVFSALTRDYPRLEQPHVQLAVLYARQDKLQKAVESLQAALKLHADEAQLQNELNAIRPQP